MTRLRRFLCRIGWHKPIYDRFDGCSFHAHCAHCQKMGMIDSQGNLF